MNPLAILHPQDGSSKEDLPTASDLAAHLGADTHECEHTQGSNNCTKLPYVSCNSVTTLDGVLSFMEPPSDIGTTGVTLRNTHPHLASTDYKTLLAGWAFSDAILSSSKCLFSEPETTYSVTFDDLIEYRLNALGKKARQPILVILTASGNVPSCHVALLPRNKIHEKVIIVTTTAGASVIANMEKQRAEDGSPVERCCHYVMVCDSEDSLTPGVDLEKMLLRLRSNHGVATLDVAAGGQVIRSMMQKKLLNEMRLSYTMQIAGTVNMLGKIRPSLFKCDDHTYTAETAPHLAVCSARLYGSHLMMLRMKVAYRH